MYYNDYARRLYSMHKYRSAINYSLLARDYALDVIDGCDDYWETFYYTYFGWSNRYGYNYNFGYANGYRDGYYDGYYAAYCARHHHDYRKDPHHNLHSDWYTNERYDRVVTNASNQSMRNQSHSGGTNTNNSRGTGFRNINRNEYYTQEENTMNGNVPDEKEMETDFRKANPNVEISDANLRKDNAVITRNRENSETFSTNTRNTTLINNTRLENQQE